VCKPCACVSFSVCAVVGGLLSSQAFLLSPPDKEEQFFPSDHMFTRIGDAFRDDFFGGTDDAYEVGNMYFGMLELHAPDFIKWKPDLNRGNVVFDSAFELRSNSSQEGYLRACSRLEDAPCDVAACSYPGATGLLAVPGSVSCPLRDFLEWQQGQGTSASFELMFMTWFQSNATVAQRRSFYLSETGEIRAAHLSFVTTMIEDEGPGVQRGYYDAQLRFIRSLNLPPPLATAFPTAGDTKATFLRMVTSETLVDGVLTGFIICFPVAFGVLFLATGSALASIYATVTIALIVGSLLGSCRYFLGWDLGISESIAAIVTIGLSVDYTVHLGHAYVSPVGEVGREGRAALALMHMGTTVFAGAVTTLGAGVFMFSCQLTFFTRMAGLISGTIFFSLLFSLFFFVPLLVLAGPGGEITSLAERAARLLAHCRSSGRKGHFAFSRCERKIKSADCVDA